jgi:hypothetical protein
MIIRARNGNVIEKLVVSQMVQKSWGAYTETLSLSSGTTTVRARADTSLCGVGGYGELFPSSLNL